MRRPLAVAALASFAAALALVPAVALAQLDPASAGVALGGGALGSLLGSLIGSAVGSSAAVRKQWDAETRAEMRNALSDGIATHEAKCLLSRSVSVPR